MDRSGGEIEALTHSQQQIWLGQTLDPQSPLYNMAFAFTLPAALDSDLFARAWQRVAGGSDALRTRIVERDRSACPVVASEAAPTEILDLRSHAEPEREFRRWCCERCARPLPTDGDLVDSVLVRLGDESTGWYLNQHHLIADAWSTQLLVQRVGEEYEALRRGGEPGERGEVGEGVPSPGESSERATPQADYYPTASRIAASVGERPGSREHWLERGLRPGRKVPLYGRAAQPSSTPSTRRTLVIDERRSRALEELARQEGFLSLSDEVSRFALFASLLVGWLHRISGEGDLGFDAPVAGRPTADARRTLGLFIEMFPFAASVEPGDSLRSLGARCLEEAKLLLAHAYPGLSSPSAEAASNIVLNYFPNAFGAFAGLPMATDWVHPGHGDRVHALRLQVHDFAGCGSYTLHFDGNDEVLPERLWRRGVEHFERLLDACLEDPDRPIAGIDIRTDEERRELAALNATNSSPWPQTSVLAKFDGVARREPDLVALRQAGVEMSFGDLRRRSIELAATLVDRGVEPGDRVAILGRRTTHAVVAILAVLRARAVYLPIESSVPPLRLEHLLRDSGARLLLLGEGAEPTDLPDGVTPLAISEALAAGAGSRSDSPAPRPDLPAPRLDDLAYLIYTSGSTGLPKGVLVEHGGLAAYLDWASRTYVRGDRLTFPLFTSLAVDLTVTSLFLPLITGGTLEIYPEGEGPVDAALFDVLEADSSDFIKLTPSHLAILARRGLENSSIRRMVVGGESLPSHLAAAVSAELHDQIEITNEYGPTEAVVGCVAHRFDPAAEAGPSVPIGRPIDHVEIEILNSASTPVPEGVPGELWVSRFGLARGYHGRDELTAERFVPRPGRPDERSYRTGDLVRMVDPERLEYLGRLDRQVKVSGVRVEPAEIEAALLSLPEVEQCAVIAAERTPTAAEPRREVRHCARCGLPSDYPRATFDEHDICSICRSYETIKERAQAYFKRPEELQRIFEESARAKASQYDCLMLFSGGKDSTYALCRLVEMGISVYAFTLDNGFISDHAKENIRRVTDQLGVPIEFATTPAMNAIFRDSLVRFANVCQGCFKTIYTLSMQRAHELGIPIIVTGLSRGQMFETRLTEEMFRDGRFSPEEIDAAVLAARKVYHRANDEVSRSLDVEMFRGDRIFEEIRFVDFYRYIDVGLDEVYDYLRQRVTWVRPKDTGRSTNCLINDTGIFVHRQQRGFHNYALPYSWDVRLGHKDREAALEELDDEIDPADVRRILGEIDFDDRRLGEVGGETVLHGFYLAGEELSDSKLRGRLAERLPPQLIPTYLRRLDALPLTAAGKVDAEALLREASDGAPAKPYRPAEGPVASFLAELWQRSLEIERIGADDSFFELGGTSLGAMEVMIGLCREFDIELPLETLFSHPRLSDLARVAEDRILADDAELG